MMLGLIVAHDSKYGIGKDSKLPWKVPADIDHFWHTIGQDPVIVGRKTWESAKKYFLKRRPNAVHIVISRGASKSFDAIWVNSTTMAFRALKNKTFAWVCGGSEIYKMFRPHVDIACETYIRCVGDCDRFVVSCWNSFNFEPYKQVDLPTKEGEPTATVRWSYRRPHSTSVSPFRDTHAYTSPKEQQYQKVINELCRL